MKTLIMITIALFIVGCGGSSVSESSTTPPQPTTATQSVKPPVSPTLE